MILCSQSAPLIEMQEDFESQGNKQGAKGLGRRMKSGKAAELI